MSGKWKARAQELTMLLTKDLTSARAPFAIEIPQVPQGVYEETRRAVEATGAFITSIRPLSIQDLLREDRKRMEGERRFSDWINPSQLMWATVPPNMEAFIDPQNVRIEDSNSLPTGLQKELIAQARAEFRLQLPEAVRFLVGLQMVDPSTYFQLEDAWMAAGRGLLFPDFFARTDVKTVEGGVADIGRIEPSDQRKIIGHNRNLGHRKVFAVPVGVLPRKLAV